MMRMEQDERQRRMVDEARARSDARLRQAVEKARYQQAFGRAVEEAFGARWIAMEDDPTVVKTGRVPFVVNRYETQQPALQLAVTCGLGAVPQQAGDEHVELAVVCERMGPRLVHLLSVLALSVHDPSRGRPLGEWDRVVYPE